MFKISYFKKLKKKVLCICLTLTLILNVSASFAAALPLPDPSNPLLYDDCGGGGVWGSQGYTWANWWNQSGGTGTCTKTTVDGRTVEDLAQVPASSSSWAKFEPWHYNANFSGYRYLNFTMKDPGFANCRVKIDIEDGKASYNLTNGWIAAPISWTNFTYDLNKYPALVKSNVHIVIWLNQITGVNGEVLLDEIKATNVASGTAPTITGIGLTSNSGSYNNENTIYTFAATYTDADNEKPFAMQVVMDDTTVYDMNETNRADTIYTDGKNYTYTTKLPVGNHTYYYRTTDTTSNSVVSATQAGPNVASYTQVVDVNDNTLGTGNNQFVYTGTGWVYGSAPAGSYQLDNHYSSTIDNYASFKFVGTQVNLYGAKDLVNGIATVSIDGGAECNVDYYAAVRQESVLMYTSPTLTNGIHTIKVRVTGTKNASSTGTLIPVDKVTATTYTGSMVSDVEVCQVGYSANDSKNAKITTVDTLSDVAYQLLDGSTVVASGNMIDEGVVWNKHVYSIDFSSYTTVGINYTIKTNNISSYVFPIQGNIWNGYKDEMTAFYRLLRSHQDTSVACSPTYSDTAPSTKAYHAPGFLDDAKSLDGTQHYDLVGSWQDAGDYGQYAGNQWVAGSIAISYLRHATNANVRYDNDANGVPDLVDESRFGCEYLIKFANLFGGALYNIPTAGGFVHPEKVTDGINNTSDDRQITSLGVGGSAKAAGSLAATARAINSALTGGYITSAKVAEFTTFAASCQAAAITFYNYAAANPNGPIGSYETIGGIPNSMLYAEAELYLLTNNSAYKTSAETRINTLTFSDIFCTNYWDQRPIAMAEFYPVASTSVQTKIQTLLKQEVDYFMSSVDDTPYGVLDEYSNFGVNEPHASFLGDVLRYYELFPDPAILRTVQKGMYWMLGENPWNTSWVSGLGTNYIKYVHTRLDEQSYDTTNKGIVLTGALVSGPNIKDTKDKKSVSPWYVDRGLFADDTNQWRYNEYSISIQSGLMYSIMALIDITGSSSGGTVPSKIEVTSPLIGDYVTGTVKIFAKPSTAMTAVDVKGSTYTSMTGTNGVYTGTIDVSAEAPLTNKRVMVRGTDGTGKMDYSSTHFTVAQPLPNPVNALLYDDFDNLGTWGSSTLGWANWWNQDGGTATYTKTMLDGRNVGKFTQTPASSSSRAKLEPWHDTVDLSGYRYLSFNMENPSSANLRINVSIEDGTSSYSLTGGDVAVPTTWATVNYDLNAFPAMNKKTAHVVVWLSEAGGTYGEMFIDDISAINLTSGTAPTITSTSLNKAVGDKDTLFTFNATYTDVDNQAPFAIQLVLDGVIHDMVGIDTSDKVYADGKAYTYSAKLPEGAHSYYFRTTDTTTNVVSSSTVSAPTVYTNTPVEAESGIRTGGAWVASNGSGFSGIGYASGFNAINDSVAITVNVSTPGTYILRSHYSNANIDARTMSLYVNGTKVRQKSFAPTGSWNNYVDAAEDTVTLVSGNNAIKYQYDTGDNGGINLDYIILQ